MKNYPFVLHLNGEGEFCCYDRGSTGESVFDWEHDPEPLLRSRSCGLASRGGCPPNWLIIETRPDWLTALEVVPGEGDVKAFLQVRGVMAEIGVNLVDDVVFDQTNRWWSLHDFLEPDQPYALRRR